MIRFHFFGVAIISGLCDEVDRSYVEVETCSFFTFLYTTDFSNTFYLEHLNRLNLPPKLSKQQLRNAINNFHYENLTENLGHL